MAATIATTAMLNAKTITTTKTKTKASINHVKPKPISLLSLQNLPPKGLSAVSSTAAAGALFSALTAADPSFAAHQIAEMAAAPGDNRGLALLLPIIPALAWVLFNITQPALNQLNRMRSTKGVIIGLGLGGLATAQLIHPYAAAADVAALADATNDNRGLLLLIVVTPALLWVAYNILQPALNQLNRMRSE